MVRPCLYLYFIGKPCFVFLVLTLKAGPEMRGAA
jgi:hypothetical protein